MQSLSLYGDTWHGCGRGYLTCICKCRRPLREEWKENGSVLRLMNSSSSSLRHRGQLHLSKISTVLSGGILSLYHVRQCLYTPPVYTMVIWSSRLGETWHLFSSSLLTCSSSSLRNWTFLLLVSSSSTSSSSSSCCLRVWTGSSLFVYPWASWVREVQSLADFTQGFDLHWRRRGL